MLVWCITSSTDNLHQAAGCVCQADETHMSPLQVTLSYMYMSSIAYHIVTLLPSQAILSQEINWDASELQSLSSAARDFLERLLQRNPVMRPCAADALELPWVKDEGAASEAPLNVRLARPNIHLMQLLQSPPYVKDCSLLCLESVVSSAGGRTCT